MVLNMDSDTTNEQNNSNYKKTHKYMYKVHVYEYDKTEWPQWTSIPGNSLKASYWMDGLMHITIL